MAASTAAAAAGATVAFAQIPDSNGVIHGCYAAGGSLRVVTGSTECLVTETPVDWSQQGPTGPEGPPGPTGPQGRAGPIGPQGAVGPSDAFASSTAAARRVGRRLTRLERLDLGAGSHVVFAKVVLSQTAEHATRVLCDLTAADTLDRFTVRLGARHSASSATVHLMLATELPASSPALLRCRYDYESATDVRAAFVQISAIRVGTLTVQ